MHSAVPVGTGISKDSSVFNCGKCKVDGSRFQDYIHIVAGSSDAHENCFNSIIRIPFGSDVVLWFWSNTSKVMVLQVLTDEQ